MNCYRKCPPGITNSPAYASVTHPAPVNFSVTATGSGLTYRWQRSSDATAWSDLFDGPIPDAGNGGTYSGCTTSALYVSSSTGLNGTFWRCVVTQGNGGKLATDYAYLTVS